MDTMEEQRRKKQAHNITNMVNHVVLDDLPENCIFDILIRLPAETLCSSRFVCKSWFEIISSHDFINAHLHRSDTTPGFISLTISEKNNLSPPPKKVFSVESNSTQLVDRDTSFHIKFMEIKDSKSTTKEYNVVFLGDIIATYNGLVLLYNNLARPWTRLIILNPVTRELEDIPLGTISSSPIEKYGLGFCHVSRRYKLLHLFMKGRLSNLGCEILDIGSGSWRAVDVPTTNYFHCVENPTFAMGGLHWIQYKLDRGEWMVSIPLDDEKYKTMAIPEVGGHQNKSIFAMGEFLGFAGRLPWPNNKIGVWILRGLGGECGWEKQYNIDVASGMGFHSTTLLYYGGDKGRAFIFKFGGDGLYAYDDRHSQHMRKIVDIDTYSTTIFPHVNSLVSWRS